MMKLANYDIKTLIYQNLRPDVQKIQEQTQAYTRTQFNILCRLIHRKKITRQFFDFILSSLFEITDWKKLNYKQMYELIHVLTFWNYQAGKGGTKL